MSDRRPDNPPPSERDRLARSLTASAAVRVKQGGKAAVFRVLGAEPDAPEPRTDRTDYLAVKANLQERLLDEIGERQLRSRGQEDVETVVQEFVARVIESEAVALNDAERVRLAEELTDEAIGLGPLTPLMGNPAVSDILVNGARHVYVERFGRIEKTPIRFRDNDHVVRIIERIAAAVGRRIDAASPMADLRLPDGSRVNATLPPVSLDGPTISIRRFGRRRLRRTELVALGSLSADMLLWLELVVQARKNVIISGGTGAGKSTLLGALAEAIPADERIVTIEDVAELSLDQEHVVRLETRPPNIEGRGRITARDLVINSLRMRPDRIIVGEVRGDEALDMLQAMNTGHDGSLSTIHANSPRDGLARLETMVLMAGTELPSRAVRERIVSAIQVLVHVRRYEDGVRRIESIAEITGIEGLMPLMQTIFEFKRRGRQDRRVVGEFVATGIVPRMVEELRDRGLTVPMDLLQAAGLNRARATGIMTLLLLVVVAMGLAAALYGGFATRVRRAGLARLDRAVKPAAAEGQRRIDASAHPFPPRYRWMGPAAGLATLCAGWFILRAPFAIGAGALVGTLAYITERAVADFRQGRIEQQLANALDLIVAAIQAGGALMSALETALEEAREPLRPFLRDMVIRLQLGDAPETVLKDFAARVPIETFRLFSVTLAAQWEVGGSLSSTLAVVARTVRDRAELSRRIWTQSAEAHFSVAVVMLLTYAVGLLMWRANPERVLRFFLSPVGAELTGAVILLQAVGLFWMSRISRVEY